MEFDVNTSAPGKILWIGGYSVLEKPNTSFVTAVKSYVTVNSRSKEGNSIELNAPQLSMNCRGSIDYSTGKINAEVPKELLLLKASADVAIRYALAIGAKIQGISINTKSDEAFSYTLSKGKIAKSGLGSSAALTVATIASVLKAFDVKTNKNQTHKLAQVAHSLATGKVGSGFDIAAATYGSIIYSRYSPEIVKSIPPDYSNDELLKVVKKKWDYTIEKFPFPKDFKVSFANFVGESMITTASVGSVSEFKKNSLEMYSELIKELNGKNMMAIDALKRINKGGNDALGQFKDAFEEGRALTKELGKLSNVGIEPDDCTNLIEESKANGAFVAKLPGAGGKDAIAAISLSKIDHMKLQKFWRGRKELKLLKIKTSKQGLKR